MTILFKTIAAVLVTGLTAKIASASNADFARKLANPANYVVDRNLVLASTESICGTNNMQQVADYDGSRGQPVEFVARHERQVAALAYGTPDSSKKYCTGTLISENLFLTAAHCIDATTLNDFAVFNYQKVRGAPGLEEQEHVKIIEVVEQGLAGLDYAIIKLEGTPGEKYGFTAINSANVDLGHLLTIIQHPSGNPKTVDVGTRKGTRGTNYMTYGDLDTEPGSSGSGVLDQNGQLVGVHTNGGCYPSGGDNAGVFMTKIIAASPVIRGLAQ
jgi:V8-like Glu-specific endopeptidase